MTKSWMLDEFAHAGREHLDPAFVAKYDRKQGVDPVDDLAVLCRHGLDATSTLLDFGAGTGQLVLSAAPLCRRVVAVDVSPPMLDHLRRQMTEARLTNIECIEAGFLTYEHDGPPVDAVYTRNALHQLPEFWKAVALDRIARMLQPGGVFRLRDLIFDFQPSEAEAVIADWLDAAADDAALGYTSEDLAEHIRSEYSTFRWLLEPMLIVAGFDIVDAEFRRSVYGSYTCIKQ